MRGSPFLKSAGALWYLAVRWMNSKSMLQASFVLAATFAVVAMVYVSVGAFTMTQAQQAEKIFGKYTQRTSTTVSVGELAFGDFDRAATALPHSHIFIESTQVRPDSFAKLYVQAPIANLRFVEDPGLGEAFPNRYTLEEGTWPKSPLEVVVTRHLANDLPNPGKFTVLSGRATFNVVGVVTDAYAERGDTIIAGPGTWESLPRQAPGREYQPTEGEVTVLFDSGTSLAEVRRGLKEALPPPPEAQGDRSANIEANYSTRAQTVAAPEPAFGAEQLVVSYIPLFLLVLLVAALGAARIRMVARGNADRLVALGVRRDQVVTTQLIAVVILTSVSIVMGLGCGWVVAIALRATILPVVDDQPLSPLPNLNLPLIAIAVTALIVTTLGTIWPSRNLEAPRGASFPRWLAELHLVFLRRFAVALSAVFALGIAGGLHAAAASYLGLGCVLLVAPDLLRLVVWALPQRRVRIFVTQRLMQRDHARQAVAVVVVAFCLAAPILTATQLVSQKASDASFSYSRVPQGEVWVQSTGAVGDVRGVARLVSRVPGMGAPIVVRGSSYAADPRDKNSAAAFFSRTPETGRFSTGLMIVRSADQVRRLVGDTLPREATPTLESGGVLDFTGAEGAQQIVVDSAAGKRLLVTPPLPTLKVALGRQLSSQFGGALLLSTARELGLPVNAPSKFIYTGTSMALIESAVQAAVDGGYDSEFVQYSVPPPPPKLPLYAYAFVGALMCAGLAVLLVIINGQARRLRSYTARLVAIGLSPSWPISILCLQAGVLVGVALGIGVLAGIGGVLVVSAKYSVLEIPTIPIAVASLIAVIGAGMATVVAGRSLTASEMEEVS